jgi:DNA-binding MarR family transcriptional regulator
MLNGLLRNGRIAKIRHAVDKFKQNRRITDIQRNFLKRLLNSKAGLVVLAFRKIQTLPIIIEPNPLAIIFEKGLSTFLSRTIKKTFTPFRAELDEGQSEKKRAVIQLINTTMGGQRKLYNRWKGFTEKARLMEECKVVTNAFTTLQRSIKSALDNVLLDS